jgi:hypothetical protein
MNEVPWKITNMFVLFRIRNSEKQFRGRTCTLKDQLKDLLENQSMHDLCFRSGDSSRHVIRDTGDGTLYQTLKAYSDEDLLPLTFNCDGVQVFSVLANSSVNETPIE